MAALEQEKPFGAFAMQRVAKRARTMQYLEKSLTHEPPLGTGAMAVGTSYRLRLALTDPRIPPENPSIIKKAFDQLKQVRCGKACGLPPYPGDGAPEEEDAWSWSIQ